jgi:hypothetical protein
MPFRGPEAKNTGCSQRVSTNIAELKKMQALQFYV